jgi:hypothetical protein
MLLANARTLNFWHNAEEFSANLHNAADKTFWFGCPMDFGMQQQNRALFGINLAELS